MFCLVSELLRVKNFRKKKRCGRRKSGILEGPEGLEDGWAPHDIRADGFKELRGSSAVIRQGNEGVSPTASRAEWCQ